MTQTIGREAEVKGRGQDTVKQEKWGSWGEEEKVQESKEDGERTWEETREWKDLRLRVRLLPKVPARSHIEVEEVDLLQVSLCLQNGHCLATQEGS